MTKAFIPKWGFPLDLRLWVAVTFIPLNSPPFGQYVCPVVFWEQVTGLLEMTGPPLGRTFTPGRIPPRVSLTPGSGDRDAGIPDSELPSSHGHLDSGLVPSWVKTLGIGT